MRRLSKEARRYWLPIFWIAVLNSVSFLVVAAVIGGDAISGKVEGGRCFVSNHGVLREVSHSTYIYSYVHTVSVWVTHGLAFVFGFLLHLNGKLYEKC